MNNFVNPTIEYTVESYAVELDGRWFPAVRVLCNGNFSHAYSVDVPFENERDCIPIANVMVHEEVERINITVKSILGGLDNNNDK